ncbi:MAG: hypothetical protein R3Y24_13855 [Eubacteriales bacterium]
MTKVKKVNKGGQPKKIKSEQELLDMWENFCYYVVESEYKITPTFMEFKRWICDNYTNIDRKTIYTSINEYFPNSKSEVERIRADVLTQGTMTGNYQPSMAIFSLKNWCSWTDKVESHNINTDSITIDFGEFDDAD